MRALLISCLFFSFLSCSDTSQNRQETSSAPPSWAMLPFQKNDYNPVLLPGENAFKCPIKQDIISWEEKDVFNPSAVVKDGKVHLIYRAEDTVGKHAGTSRLGLAISENGYHFDKLQEPIFYPDNDSMKVYEWEGGVEDPRIVESEDERYILTYTAYDGDIARLCLASSSDLMNWTKHGLVLGQAFDGKYKDRWSKSGAIVSKRVGDKIIAQKINGKYWMYWGDTEIFICTSDDLINWMPVETEDGDLWRLFGPRPGYFDSQLVEPGPAPLITKEGIVFIYNSRNHEDIGTPDLPKGTYSAGQVLINKEDPTEVLDRLEKNFFQPEADFEINGQVGNVVFLEGLVPFKGQWLLYYGTADSKIGMAYMKMKN